MGPPSASPQARAPSLSSRGHSASPSSRRHAQQSPSSSSSSLRHAPQVPSQRGSPGYASGVPGSSRTPASSRPSSRPTSPTRGAHHAEPTSGYTASEHAAPRHTAHGHSATGYPSRGPPSVAESRPSSRPSSPMKRSSGLLVVGPGFTNSRDSVVISHSRPSSRPSSPTRDAHGESAPLDHDVLRKTQSTSSNGSSSRISSPLRRSPSGSAPTVPMSPSVGSRTPRSRTGQHLLQPQVSSSPTGLPSGNSASSTPTLPRRRLYEPSLPDADGTVPISHSFSGSSGSGLHSGGNSAMKRSAAPKEAGPAAQGGDARQGPGTPTASRGGHIPDHMSEAGGLEALHRYGMPAESLELTLETAAKKEFMARQQDHVHHRRISYGGLGQTGVWNQPGAFTASFKAPSPQKGPEEEQARLSAETPLAGRSGASPAKLRSSGSFGSHAGTEDSLPHPKRGVSPASTPVAHRGSESGPEGGRGRSSVDSSGSWRHEVGSSGEALANEGLAAAIQSKAAAKAAAMIEMARNVVMLRAKTQAGEDEAAAGPAPGHTAGGPAKPEGAAIASAPGALEPGPGAGAGSAAARSSPSAQGQGQPRPKEKTLRASADHAMSKLNAAASAGAAAGKDADAAASVLTNGSLVCLIAPGGHRLAATESGGRWELGTGRLWDSTEALPLEALSFGPGASGGKKEVGLESVFVLLALGGGRVGLRSLAADGRCLSASNSTDSPHYFAGWYFQEFEQWSVLLPRKLSATEAHPDEGKSSSSRGLGIGASSSSSSGYYSPEHSSSGSREGRSAWDEGAGGVREGSIVLQSCAIPNARLHVTLRGLVLRPLSAVKALETEAAAARTLTAQVAQLEESQAELRQAKQQLEAERRQLQYQVHKLLLKERDRMAAASPSSAAGTARVMASVSDGHLAEDSAALDVSSGDHGHIPGVPQEPEATAGEHVVLEDSPLEPAAPQAPAQARAVPEGEVGEPAMPQRAGEEEDRPATPESGGVTGKDGGIMERVKSRAKGASSFGDLNDLATFAAGMHRPHARREASPQPARQQAEPPPALSPRGQAAAPSPTYLPPKSPQGDVSSAKPKVSDLVFGGMRFPPRSTMSGEAGSTAQGGGGGAPSPRGPASATAEGAAESELQRETPDVLTPSSLAAIIAKRSSSPGAAAALRKSSSSASRGSSPGASPAGPRSGLAAEPGASAARPGPTAQGPMPRKADVAFEGADELENGGVDKGEQEGEQEARGSDVSSDAGIGDGDSVNGTGPDAALESLALEAEEQDAEPRPALFQAEGEEEARGGGQGAEEGKKDDDSSLSQGHRRSNHSGASAGGASSVRQRRRSLSPANSFNSVQEAAMSAAATAAAGTAGAGMTSDSMAGITSEEESSVSAPQHKGPPRRLPHAEAPTPTQTQPQLGMPMPVNPDPKHQPYGMPSQHPPQHQHQHPFCPSPGPAPAPAGGRRPSSRAQDGGHGGGAHPPGTVQGSKSHDGGPPPGGIQESAVAPVVPTVPTLAMAAPPPDTDRSKWDATARWVEASVVEASDIARVAAAAVAAGVVPPHADGAFAALDVPGMPTQDELHGDMEMPGRPENDMPLPPPGHDLPSRRPSMTSANRRMMSPRGSMARQESLSGAQRGAILAQQLSGTGGPPDLALVDMDSSLEGLSGAERVALLGRQLADLAAAPYPDMMAPRLPPVGTPRASSAPRGDATPRGLRGLVKGVFSPSRPSPRPSSLTPGMPAGAARKASLSPASTQPPPALARPYPSISTAAGGGSPVLRRTNSGRAWEGGSTQAVGPTHSSGARPIRATMSSTSSLHGNTSHYSAASSKPGTPRAAPGTPRSSGGSARMSPGTPRVSGTPRSTAGSQYFAASSRTSPSAYAPRR